MPYSDFAAVVDHFVAGADEDGAHDDRDEAIEGRRARVVAVGRHARRACHRVATASSPPNSSRSTNASPRSNSATTSRRIDMSTANSPTASRSRAPTASAASTRSVAIFRAAAIGRRHRHGRRTARQHRRRRRHVGSDCCSPPGSPRRPISAVDRSTRSPDSPSTEADDLLADLTGSPARICETTNGVPLHPHAGCELPTAWCEVDHVDEWDRDLGPTDQRNSAVLCRAHNNDKHRRTWRTRRAQNGCSYTIREDGSVILPVGARPPDFTDRDDPDDEADTPEALARLATFVGNRLAADLARHRQRSVQRPGRWDWPRSSST